MAQAGDLGEKRKKKEEEEGSVMENGQRGRKLGSKMSQVM